MNEQTETQDVDLNATQEAVKPTQDQINRWYELQAKLREIKAEEMFLRILIYKGLFPKPSEGTNTFDLGVDKWAFKAQRVIDRKVDEAALAALKEDLIKEEIPVDDLIRWKPELEVKKYRALTAEQRTRFEQVLIIKDGSPQLELVQQKRAARK